jgi:hypothetical protein
MVVSLTEENKSAQAALYHGIGPISKFAIPIKYAYNVIANVLMTASANK